jgi:S1-C subfamily serine protease
MVSAWILGALFLTAGVASTQATGVLHVTVTLPDATQSPVPIARHALLISDNPPTREPRRVLTAADGTVVVNLAPGSYIVESDRPVGFAGKAYQWTSIVDVVAGRDTRLALTGQNAEELPLTAAAPDAGASSSDSDVLGQLAKWQTSLVTVWSPTAKTSGFVIDAGGLIATDRNGVGDASSVEVQLSPVMKVPARVLVADSAQDVAIVWIDASVLGQALPLTLACPPAPIPSLQDGGELVAMAASLHGTGNPVEGEITGFHPRGIETDMRLAFGEAGGPVFAGDRTSVVGLTSMDAGSGNGDVRVVRAGVICEAASAARSKMPGTAAPAPTLLPLEPESSFPTESTKTAAEATGAVTTPPVVSSSDFDVAFITPRAVQRAREKAGWTGGRSVRPAEAEARLGRLTDFGSWAEYFADLPAVLIVRVTPRLAESVWMRIAREAARTQGAALPPFKDFKTNFLRLRASCGSAHVVPIHPFVLEHPVSANRIVREGLYVYGPDAFGPHCASVTLALSSEQAPDKEQTLTIDPKLIEKVWEDFAPSRTAGR